MTFRSNKCAADHALVEIVIRKQSGIILGTITYVTTRNPYDG
jgi:hypothetical protein